MRRLALARDEGGASLVELLVAMLLVGIIAAAATTSIVTMQRTHSASAELQADLDTARVALDRARREVRGARGVTSDSTSQRLQLRLAGPGGVAQQLVTWELVEAGERVHLQRYVGGPTAPRRTVARDLLPTSSFGYDEAPPKAAQVDITLHVATGGRTSLTAEASVRLRNVQN